MNDRTREEFRILRERNRQEARTWEELNRFRWNQLEAKVVEHSRGKERHEGIFGEDGGNVAEETRA